MSAAHAEPLRIFYFNWVGYGPLLVAQEKGFFAKEGIEVELINNEVHAAAFGGLSTNQVDAVAGALLAAPAYAEPHDPIACVLVMDDSRGADGIVASKDVHSIADLKGKSVAVLRGGLQQFYLDVLLKGGRGSARPRLRSSILLPKMPDRPFCYRRWTPQ